jgi:hypothetical protein
VAPKVVAAGLRCIVSNQDKWYLDHLDASWEGFYMNEPLKGINDTKQQQLVIGGEVCMWGEEVDASDIEQTIWPRTAAAAGNYKKLENLILCLQIFQILYIIIVQARILIVRHDDL